MGNVNVAVLGSKDFAAAIGKKGTVTDVTFFDYREGQDSYTLIEDTKYPEKLSSLFIAVSMAHYVILVVEKIDSFLGETIVMVDAAKQKQGCIILRNYIQVEQIKPIIAGTCLESYEIISEDNDSNTSLSMREKLINLAKAQPTNFDENTGICPVDSHFNVKGVGTVILGAVVEGKFAKHDELTVYPLKRKVMLKSIQRHDVDCDECIRGDHVGFALRGIESDELDRGYVLATDADIKTSFDIKGTFWPVKFSSISLKKDMVVHLGHWMQMIPCRVISVDGNDDDNNNIDNKKSIVLRAESELIYKTNDNAVIMYLEGGKLRILANMSLI